MTTMTRSLSLLLVTLFVGSLLSGAAIELNKEPAPSVLENEPAVMAAQSPGHPVFAQYISSDNCPHCYKAGGGSESHHNLKLSNGDEYVYITYMSLSYGDTDTARAGNVGPYTWPWTTTGAPIAYFGDRTDAANTMSGASSSGTNYDSYFTAGGGMHPDVNDYKMTAAISPNGGVFDISVDYQYVGSGTPVSNLNVYAAVIEESCTTHTYSNSGGSNLAHGYHCWMGWLTSGNTYRSASGGSGSTFASVSPTSTAQSLTWNTVPTSLIQGGTSNAMVVAVLMSGGVSVGGSSPHVYHAVDSSMGPKMDIAVTDLRLSNTAGNEAYVLGDIVELEADVKNVGDLDYTNGGNLEFYYKNGATTTVIDTTTVPTLNVAAGSSFLTASATFDTSTLPANAWSTVFGARLTGVTGESTVSNNMAEDGMDHDRPPLAKTPQVIDTNVVERGGYLTLLAKGAADDNVDSIDTLSFEVEVSPAGADTWDAGIVAGGDTILYRDTPQEGREYIITPSETMTAGMYDVRSRTMDARMQASPWSVAGEVFELANGLPQVIADPVPSVMCDLSTRISMDGHISDPETPLSDLIVTSTSPYFVAWHADAEELEVLFPYDMGCPLGQRGIEVTVDDGAGYDEGSLPYGTLLFNVIENGQPRWAGLPIQSVDEGGSGSFSLATSLTDTDDSGNTADIADLTLSIMENSNPDVFTASLRGTMLNFETVDDDINGETVLTLRASDGEQFSDQTITLRVNPINDAPRLDMTDLESITLKRGSQMVINLKNRMVDVDNPVDQAFITVTPDEPGAARYNILDGNMIVVFQETGAHSITVSTTDGSDTNSYTIDVDVYDALPFYFSKTDDGSGYMYVSLVNTYVGQNPTATLMLTEDAPVFTNMDLTVQLCSELTGVCFNVENTPLDVARSNVGWTMDLEMRTSGSQMSDYYQFKMMASDADGEDYNTVLNDGIKFLITENLPAPVDMEDAMLTSHVENLQMQIETLEARIASLEAGTESGDLEGMTTDLATLQADLTVACDDPRADCPTEATQSGTADDAQGGLDTNIILIVVGVLIVAALLGLMFMRGGSREDEFVDTKWNEATLPVHDEVANSMYGGAQDIFQQPMAAAPAPLPAAAPAVAPIVEPQPVSTGPALPPGGLPAGWSMEQWAYYGQQYLDSLNQ